MVARLGAQLHGRSAPPLRLFRRGLRRARARPQTRVRGGRNLSQLPRRLRPGRAPSSSTRANASAHSRPRASPTNSTPASATANVYLAVTQLAYGEPAGARELLLKGKEVDPNGVAGPGALNCIAYELAANGRRDAGLELLKLAVELHPKEANLYDSIGEFYALKGQKDKAVEFYSKALEVDPNLASAKSALEKLKN